MLRGLKVNTTPIFKHAGATILGDHGLSKSSGVAKQRGPGWAKARPVHAPSSRRTEMKHCTPVARDVSDTTFHLKKKDIYTLTAKVLDINKALGDLYKAANANDEVKFNVNLEALYLAIQRLAKKANEAIYKNLKEHLDVVKFQWLHSQLHGHKELHSRSANWHEMATHLAGLAEKIKLSLHQSPKPFEDFSFTPRPPPRRILSSASHIHDSIRRRRRWLAQHQPMEDFQYTLSSPVPFAQYISSPPVPSSPVDSYMSDSGMSSPITPVSSPGVPVGGTGCASSMPVGNVGVKQGTHGAVDDLSAGMMRVTLDRQMPAKIPGTFLPLADQPGVKPLSSPEATVRSGPKVSEVPAAPAGVCTQEKTSEDGPSLCSEELDALLKAFAGLQINDKPRFNTSSADDNDVTFGRRVFKEPTSMEHLKAIFSHISWRQHFADALENLCDEIEDADEVKGDWINFVTLSCMHVAQAATKGWFKKGEAKRCEVLLRWAKCMQKFILDHMNAVAQKKDQMHVSVLLSNYQCAMTALDLSP